MVLTTRGGCSEYWYPVRWNLHSYHCLFLDRTYLNGPFSISALSFSFALSNRHHLSLLHTYTHHLYLTYADTPSLSHAHTSTLSHTHTIFLSHTHKHHLPLLSTHIHHLSHTHQLSITHTISLSQTRKHTISASHTISLNHTHTHPFFNTFYSWIKKVNNYLQLNKNKWRTMQIPNNKDQSLIWFSPNCDKLDI